MREIPRAKPNEAMVRIEGRRAWHFPRLANGTYLGHHPANSEAAIVHLQTMRALGAAWFALRFVPVLRVVSV